MSMPLLAKNYMSAQKRVFGVDVFIPTKCYDRFRKCESVLRRNGIESWDFSLGVSVLLEKFVKSKGMKCVPVNMFTGRFAQTKYINNI